MPLDPPNAPQALASYRLALATDSPEAILRGTADYFDAACDAQVVPPLTINPDDLDDAPEDTGQRIRAVRDRLRRLGYALPPLAEPAEAAWGSDVAAALAHFVAEAGLPVPDETTGELTAIEWDALQQLFSFETPLVPADWFDHGSPSAPLRRATRLRLSVLGFGSPPKPGDFEPAPSSLADFADTAFRLGVTDTPLPTALTPAFAAALFDHDNLVHRLSLSAPKLAAISFFHRARAESFLVCVAKVELWLFGYDVMPDGTADLSTTTHALGPHGAFTTQNNSTADAIVAFWNDTQPADTPAFSAAGLTPTNTPAHIPELLARMVALHRTDTATLPHDQASDLLVAELQTRIAQKPELWTAIQNAAARLVSALFDGIRRVFSWLRNVFNRAWDTLTTATYNLWRAVHHFMGSAAFNLRRALNAVADGLSFVLHPTRASAPTGAAVVHRSFDGDFRLLVDPAANPAEVTAFARALVHGAEAFAVACRIFRLAVTAIHTALLAPSASLGGFVPIIFGLASIYSQVRLLVAQLDALDANTVAAFL